MLALVVIGGGLALLFTDRQTVGLVAILAPLATLAGVFIYTQRKIPPEQHAAPGDVDSTEHLRRAEGTRRNRG